MRAIQDVGIEIHGNQPSSFYIFLGSEWGIKDSYINILRNHYSTSKECGSVNDLIKLMHTKHIIPLVPTLYIVRYDSEFISSLDNKSAEKIRNTNICGTIVCVYESEKDSNKCGKYLGDYSVSFDAVNPQFVHKHLVSEFSNLPDNIIKLAMAASTSYGKARLICSAISCLPQTDLDSVLQLNYTQFAELFGHVDPSSDIDVRKGIASRNFAYLMTATDRYKDEPYLLYYAFLSTMIELDKIQSSKYSTSEIRDYAKYWSRQDIYYMFMHSYDALKRSRSAAGSSVSDLDTVIWLASLLSYQCIPDLEVFS